MSLTFPLVLVVIALEFPQQTASLLLGILLGWEILASPGCRGSYFGRIVRRSIFRNQDFGPIWNVIERAMVRIERRGLPAIRRRHFMRLFCLYQRSLRPFMPSPGKTALRTLAGCRLSRPRRYPGPPRFPLGRYGPIALPSAIVWCAPAQDPSYRLQPKKRLAFSAVDNRVVARLNHPRGQQIEFIVCGNGSFKVAHVHGVNAPSCHFSPPVIRSLGLLHFASSRTRGMTECQFALMNYGNLPAHVLR